MVVVPHLAQLCVAATSSKTNTLWLAAECLCTSSIFGSDLFNIRDWKLVKPQINPLCIKTTEKSDKLPMSYRKSWTCVQQTQQCEGGWQMQFKLTGEGKTKGSLRSFSVILRNENTTTLVWAAGLPNKHNEQSFHHIFKNITFYFFPLKGSLKMLLTDQWLPPPQRCSNMCWALGTLAPPLEHGVCLQG